MDLKFLREVIKLFKESGLAKLSVKKGDLEISLEREGQSTGSLMPDFSGMKELADISLEDTVNAPMVGSFYRSASPDSKPFVELGDRVKKGDTLCIIEAMKVMNEIKAERDGMVKEIKATDGESIEFGKPLFVME
ncbi:MAG: Biotin carboxyl carrier protein of acetyl-CoA carboxylase [Chlamydiia bacterium]|nr:Biotin carboxyl carrier protein of acetyl-CoA carboxylase [Chlamydiia bacterium]